MRRWTSVTSTVGAIGPVEEALPDPQKLSNNGKAPQFQEHRLSVSTTTSCVQGGIIKSYDSKISWSRGEPMLNELTTSYRRTSTMKSTGSEVALDSGSHECQNTQLSTRLHTELLTSALAMHMWDSSVYVLAPCHDRSWSDPTQGGWSCVHALLERNP